jgi:signal peptidase II
VTTAEVTAPTRPRSAAFARAGVTTAAVLTVDQVTKHTIATGIAPGEQKKFLPLINLVHVRNNGVAFGFLSGGGGLVLAFTLIALAILISYFWMRPSRPYLWIPVGLLTGGAIGNLVDRLANGSVTDFIKLPHWPAFNVADMAITFGVLALVYVLEGRRKTDAE